MKKILGSTLLSLTMLTGFSFAYAQEHSSQPEQQAQVNTANLTDEINQAANAQSSIQKVQTPDTELRKKIIQYIRNNNLSSNGRSAFFGIATIEKSISNPDYGKYRVMAYEEAYLSALTKFMQSFSVNIAAETEKKLFQDMSDNRDKFEEKLNEGQSAAGSVIDKMIALAGAKLDKALNELGVDAAQYNAAPADQKKAMLENSIIQKNALKMSKSLGGVTTAQTFFMNNAEGTGAVGVILVYSPKIESIAEALKQGKQPAINKLGKPLDQLLPLDNAEKMSTMLGTRLLVDDQGPVVVAFGQWANSSKSQDPSTMARYRDAAFKQANDSALKEISAFLNQSYSYESDSERGQIISETAIKEGKTGMVSTENSKIMIDKIREHSKSKTNALLQGAQILHEWVYETPEGHELVGVVVSYSFKNIIKAKTVFDKNHEPTTQQKQIQHDPSYEEGAVSIDLDTF